jgi:outer membrane immunogenic protein
MKRLAFAVALSACAGSAALAADLPQPAPPPPRAPAAYVPAPPLYNWSGFYLGGNLGAGWSSGSFTDTLGHTFSTSSNAQFVGGGQVGFNYEFLGGVVIGVEGDFDWLPNTGNTATTPGGNSVTVNDRWLATLTGRLGYAFDRVLVYGKGGGAWVGASNPTITVGGTPYFPSTSSTNMGWTAGFGVEWAFAGTWSVRAEYDFVGLNSQSWNIPALADVVTSNNRDFQMFTVGLNYKFGPW